MSFEALWRRPVDHDATMAKNDEHLAELVAVYLDWEDDESLLDSKRSTQRCAPVAVSMSWPVMRTRFAALRTLPSST